MLINFKSGDSLQFLSYFHLWNFRPYINSSPSLNQSCDEKWYVGIRYESSRLNLSAWWLRLFIKIVVGRQTLSQTTQIHLIITHQTYRITSLTRCNHYHNQITLVVVVALFIERNFLNSFVTIIIITTFWDGWIPGSMKNWILTNVIIPFRPFRRYTPLMLWALLSSIIK